MKINLIIAALCLAIGASITKYYFPTLRTETVEVEVTKTNIVTETREITHKDGTKEVVTVSTDKSIKKSTETAIILTASPKPKWHASISATRSAENLISSNMVYGAQLDYAILGPITIGVRADSSKQVGLTLGVSF